MAESKRKVQPVEADKVCFGAVDTYTPRQSNGTDFHSTFTGEARPTRESTFRPEHVQEFASVPREEPVIGRNRAETSIPHGVQEQQEPVFFSQTFGTQREQGAAQDRAESHKNVGADANTTEPYRFGQQFGTEDGTQPTPRQARHGSRRGGGIQLPYLWWVDAICCAITIAMIVLIILNFQTVMFTIFKGIYYVLSTIGSLLLVGILIYIVLRMLHIIQ